MFIDFFLLEYLYVLLMMLFNVWWIVFGKYIIRFFCVLFLGGVSVVGILG